MSTFSWENSIQHFLDEAGSSSATPGGGSVAALVAALGASMTSMVAALSKGEKYKPIQPLVNEITEEMKVLIRESEQLLQADIASFGSYMDALRLPKDTADETAIRQLALAEAAKQAIEVPLSLIILCKSGLKHTSSIVLSSNKNVISDLGIGAILFEAAAQSALLTIEINLASLKDMEQRAAYEHKVYSAMNEISHIKTETLNAVQNKINSIN